jgi:DNA-binding ferritin-like protein
MTMSLVSAAEGKYDHINFVPPESVANAAAKGLEYRQKASPSNRGGLTPEQAAKEGVGSGVQRASDLKNRKTLSPETINKMVAFFARHEKNKSVKDGKKPWEDKGHVAWLLWGGDPGKTWAEKVKKQMETADQKKQANHTPEHDVAQRLLSHLLAALRAAQQSHWTMHWQVQGTSFYGDHQMFERLYEGLTEEIDTLAEKMVAGFGEGVVSLPEQMQWQAYLAHEWDKDDDLYYRALHIEQYLQKHFKQTYDALKRIDQMSLGLDDFLMSTANSHETNLYLLGQRIGTKLAAKGRLKYRVYLFSDDPTSGKPLWTKEFHAEDDARADQEALRLVRPQLNKHDNAEDWVVEPVGHKGKKASKTAKSNAKFIEAPHNFHPVKVEPPKAKRSEFPFEGFIDFQGILIDVENTKGSTRKGKGPEGEWSTYMHSHYGEIRGTEGVDGDKLDVYVGDNHDSPVVVVIHQHNPWDGKYDEDKVMIGFDSVEEAIGAYKKQYDRPGFYIMDGHTAMNIGAFWRWVKDTRNKGKKVTAAKKNAGWWAVNHEGGSVPPPVDKGGLLNAIPGVDGADQSLYNGDGPADIMDVAIRDIIGTYEQAWGRKPFIEEVQAVFKFCANPKVLESSDGLKWAERAAKFAAQVGTDTATVYAIAPEQLASIIEAGAWGLEWKNGTAGADDLIRQHGGAVFHTGGDGMFDVEMPDALKEFGLTEPYGTEAFDPKAIAAKYLAKQAGNNAAVQGIFDGIPSDGGAWHGGPPKFAFDFTGPKAKIVAHSERNGVHEWKVKFIFEPSQTGSGSGGYVESFLIKRHLKAFPQDKNAVLEEAARRFSKEAGKLSQHVQKHVLTQTWKYVSATVGYQNAEEYENESASNVNVRWSNKPVLSRHQDAIWFPAEVTATIKATKLPSLSKGVFTEMDDRELDYWISRWEGMAPENFWADGELNMSRSQAMQHYRKQWRNWTPRQQESMWNDLKSNRYASQKWTREITLRKLMNAGAYDRGSTWPDSKDVDRISDIAYKGRDADGMTRLAIKQAKLIKDIAKAIRRGYAAETHRGKNPTITEVVSQIFYTRALELAGLGRMEVPTVAPKAKPKFNPPAIPTNLVPTDARGWQLYSMGGAETAAKGLSSVMQNALMSVGRNVTPYNTDSANAKNLSAIIDRMHKALSTRSQYGASDSEPRNVMYDVFEGYLKLYLDRWEWPKTWQVING